MACALTSAWNLCIARLLDCGRIVGPIPHVGPEYYRHDGRGATHMDAIRTQTGRDVRRAHPKVIHAVRDGRRAVCSGVCRCSTSPVPPRVFVNVKSACFQRSWWLALKGE